MPEVSEWRHSIGFAAISRFLFVYFVVILVSRCSVYDETLVSNNDSVTSDKPLSVSADASLNVADSAEKDPYSLKSNKDGDGQCTLASGDARCSPTCIELCNGIDDDCDGETDEEEATSSCQLDHAQVACHMGECLIASCDSGFGDCDDRSDNGCETPINTLQHCSDCNNPCQLDHAVASCDTQQCVIEQCESGWIDCDLVDDNGCEHDENLGECPVLSVSYMPGEGDTKWIRLQFIIRNHKPTDISISDVTLRYYYTVDSDSTDQSFECWHPEAAEGCDVGLCCDDNVVIRIDATTGTNTDHYVEVSFSGDMTIPPAGQTDVLSIGVHKNSWDVFDYTNDYSYQQVTEFTSTEHITLYYQGDLVWGIEP